MNHSEYIIDKRNEYLMPCLGFFYKNPPVFIRGDMQYLYDSNNRKYLDFFAGVSVMNCGHSNPRILDPVIEQLTKLQHVTNVYLTSPIVELAEKLSTVLLGELNNSFFCMSGSEANEGAMLLARSYTKKKKFIILKNSLHGRTHLTMSATDIPMWRADPFLSEDFYVVDSNPDTILKDLEEILNKDHNIAAFLCEPIQGNGGIITPPMDYFKNIKTLLERHQVLFICDEVQTGFARTGTMFAIEQYDVVPDIITMAKALGNGIPIAAFATTKQIASTFTSPSASTLGGNPVSSTAALAVLDYIDKENLCERASELGTYLYDKLVQLKYNYSFIKEVRGKGLMLGMELASKENMPLPQVVEYILEMLKDNGIILGKNGLHRNVLAFQPPLVITYEDIDFLIATLENAFRSIPSELL